MRKSVGFLLILCFVLSANFVFAQEGENLNPFKEMRDIREKLKNAYEEFIKVGTAHDVDLYPLALARIEVAEEIERESPRSEESKEAFELASFLAEAALKQLKAEENKVKALTIQKETESLLAELNAVHEEINNIERGYGSRIREQLVKTQEELAKTKQEAEMKFNELQSELISVKRDARGTIITMSDILFDVGKATLTEELKTNLAKISGILTVYKEPRVVVEGHTDNTGSEEFNQKLSEERANNVMNFLIEQGVSAERLSAVGYGFRRPVADNSTKEGRQKNRRVDLIVQD